MALTTRSGSGKIDATVVDKHDWHLFADDAAGFRYFIFHNAVSELRGLSFYDLVVGSRIRLTPIAHPKGARGIEVEIISL